MERLQIRYRQQEQELESRLGGLGDSPAFPPPGPYLALAAAATASGRRHRTRAALAVGLRRSAPPELLGEALLQTYLFAGYPRAINALAILHSLLPHPAVDAVTVDLAPRAGEVESWARTGPDLCRRVYGEKYAKLLRTMARLSPDLARWMILEGYGKVLSRPALSPATRELVAVAALIPLDVPDQLRAHVRGALYVGAPEAAVRRVIELVGIWEPGRTQRAAKLLASVAGDPGLRLT